MINYDDKFDEWVAKNLKDVKAATNKEWLKLKVKNFVDKHKVSSVEELMDKIQNDDVVASFFAKDPSKQGIHEETAAEYLKTIFSDLVILPKSGKNSKYVVNGEVSSNRPDKTYKSIDFVFTHSKFTIYASHKYTKISGGAQDNQRNDLISFITHSAKPKNDKDIFVAITDGPYYEENDQRNLKEIQSHSQHERVFAENSDKLKKHLDDIILNISK